MMPTSLKRKVGTVLSSARTDLHDGIDAAPRGGGRIAASRGPLSFLARYVRRRFLSHLIVLLCVIAAVVCAIGSQYAVKSLVDVLGIKNPTSYAIWGTVALLLGLVATDNLLWRVAGWASTYAFVQVGGDIRMDLFGHLSGHGAGYFMERFPGALAARITAAANVTWTIESSLTWTTIPPAAAVIASIIVLGSINWRLTAVLFLVVAVLGAIIGWLAAHGRELHHRYAGHAARVSGDLTDVVSNIGLVRSFGAARREQERLNQNIEKEMQAQRASLQSLERLRLFHAVSVFAVTAGVLVWSVELWRRGAISTGDVVLTTTLGFTVLHASRDFALALVDMVQQVAKLAEAVQVLGLPHEMEDAPDAKPLHVLTGGVRFEQVTFTYPNGRTVLRDFELRVSGGERVGIAGRSGAGKTTIAALLQRLYDPDRGAVLIDGQNIARVTQESLRRSIAVVHQDISLLHRSILENLRYGRPEASDEEVFRAVEAARCTELIQSLAQGYSTIVGERGMRLSGGQRQRIAIARAFLMDSPIVLLDEATSAIDTESEQSIQEALSRLFKGRTVIAIAHRLSTINEFDRVVVIDRGRVVEEGPPQELLRKLGHYSRMHRRQFGGSRGVSGTRS
jgi:ATP-binding cassette, subfamily B, bacterial